MGLYEVNATVSMAAWVTLEADSETDALDKARELSAANYDTDTSTATLDFNVTPAVTPA